MPDWKLTSYLQSETGEVMKTADTAMKSWKRRHPLLDDERFGVEDEWPQQKGRDGVMFGSRLEDKTFISGQLTVLHLFYCPFTCPQNTHLSGLQHRDPEDHGGVYLPSYLAMSSSASSFLALDTTQLKRTGESLTQEQMNQLEGYITDRVTHPSSVPRSKDSAM